MTAILITVLRVAVGLAAAALAAGLVLTLHVLAPAQLAVLGQDEPLIAAARVLELVALLATQAAIFVIPFGLLTAVMLEVNDIRGLLAHLVVGLVLAGMAFALHVQAEDDLRTVINAFAIQAFVLQGLVAGFVYWLVAGRRRSSAAHGDPTRAPPSGEPAEAG